ncbi:MAG: metal ABC transporter substrate-binding protein [Elusimicrobia bacterium]|nr:metal ABC transporter substrate-binding protein [Candidatus Liberimonas magnetica]
MRKILNMFCILIIGLSPAEAMVKIAASLPDMASIAAYIGGDKVEVFSIAKNNANPHVVEVLPSYMIKVSKADIYLKSGLSLDQWADEILDGSRNSRILVADCSKGIAVLQKPQGKVDASMGDVHPEGNPHYWLDPANGIVIAENVLSVLKAADPANSRQYENNYRSFKEEAQEKITDWKAKMQKVSGSQIISYHSSWVYFASAFNLIITDNVEPLPGIPPTGKHLAELINVIKSNKITVLLQEPYFPDEAPKFLSRQTGIKVFKFTPSCADASRDSYFKHFDEMIDRLGGN